jgi:hypothetical protein
MKRFKSWISLFLFSQFVFISLSLPAFADSRLGANKAVPTVFAYFDSLHIAPSTQYTLSDSDLERLFGIAADIHINVFEIIDCANRYSKPKGIRIQILGQTLRKMQSLFDLGGDRVLAIIAVNKLLKLETGARQTDDQKDLDIYIDSLTETDFEIGTAMYQQRYGFATVSPLLFSGAYGVMVRKMVFSTPLEKLELFAPGKGAIYVKGLTRPKRWNLDVITRLR